LNGILISPGNVIELKAAIEKMLSIDDEALIRMKLNSIQKVKSSFLWDKIIERTIEVIKNLTAR
jgi:glycosyltransferase involved in cell wall biosynthesis